MDSQVSPKKKSILKKWWFWVIAVIVLFIIISATSGGSSSAKSVPAAADTSSAPASTNTPAAQAPAPQTLLNISGSGTKSTAQFTAAGNWDLNYSYDCSKFVTGQGNFIVMIYNGDGSMSLSNQGVNQEGASGSDVEHYYKGGTYYLEVNSECSWKINVKG